MLKKLVKYVLLFVFVTTLCGGGYLYYRLQRAIPSYEGELTLDILAAPVRVEYDDYGIPHVKASSELDARRALGYLMARERLFQMDIYRLIAKGELSKVIGPDALILDKLYRTLGMRRVSERWIKEGVLGEVALEQLEAFFEGVNAFASEGNLPFEYLLLGRTPERFGAVDALSFIGYMAYSFNVPARQDLLLSQFEAKFGFEAVNALRGEPHEARQMTASVDASRLGPDLTKNLAAMEALFDRFGRIEGSNAWVLSGERSESGFPILASDPHISFTLPSLWFEAHLEFDRAGERISEYGHFLPLIGVPVMAHNERYGWGLTMSFIDDMDFYQEKFNESRDQVLYRGEWTKVERVKEVIEVKGAKPLELDIAVTPHGPLVDHVFDTKDVSVWWAFTQMDNRAITSFFEMGRAKNYEEFAKAVSLGGGPGMNVLYADREGHIGHWMFGQIPLRPQGNRGDFLQRGDDGSSEFLGPLPFAAKPHQLDPPTGVIVSANQRPPGSDPSIVGDYQSPDRYNTISAVLAQKERWNIDELTHVQTLSYNLSEDWKRKILISDLKASGKKLAHPELLSELEAWDGISHAHARAPLIYHHWLYVVERLLLDELDDEEFLGFCRLNAEMKALSRLLESEDSSWWDLKESEGKIEGRREVVSLAWFKMIEELKDELGENPQNWRWGKMHGLPFVHPLGVKGVLSKILTYGPYPASGAFNNVNNLRRIGCSEGHIIRAGPSTRRLVDFKDSTLSKGVLPLGNSGHLLSKHFKDQLPLYLKGEYREQQMSFSDDRKVLHLLPGK